MGVPVSRRTEFRTVVDNVFATHLNAEEQAANTAALYHLLDALIETKHAKPGEDMTSLLIAARDDEGDGSVLSHAELRDTLLLMISAGYETTVNVIDQAITTLLTDPQHLAHVREGTLYMAGRRRGDPAPPARGQASSPALRPHRHPPPRRTDDQDRGGDPRLLCRRQPPPRLARGRRPLRRHPPQQGASRLRTRRPLLPRCSAGPP